MRLKTITSAAVLALAASSASALTTWDLGPYTVEYDETTPVFGFLAGAFSSINNSVGFNWNVSTALSVFQLGDGSSGATFALPSFTVTANPGYVLSGPVEGFLGNITFTEVAGGSVSVSAEADVAFDGGAPSTISGALTRNVIATGPSFTLGYFDATATSPPMSMQSFSVSNGSLTVETSGAGANSFASLQGQPQNQLRVSFTAAPIPEPGTYALMLAGLGAVGFIARRRKS